MAGATGVLGRAIVPALTTAGYDVSALVRRPTARDEVAALGARPVDGDLLGGIEPIDADVVVHAATAIPRPDTDGGSWERNDRIRIAGTEALVDAARRSGVRRIVAVGIARVYGDHGDEWITEDTAVSAPSRLRVELRSALAFERTVQRSGLDWCVLRAGWVYGPGTGVTEALLADARAGRLRTNGSGDGFVSMVSAADVAAAVVLATDVFPSRSIVNVVDDTPMRQRDLFDVFARHVGGPAPTPGPAGSGWESQRVSNRLARSFGFRPAFSDVAGGLAELFPAAATAAAR